MSLPIIFLNYGNPWYLKYALTQCRGTNPHARIILLGDASNYGYAGVEHHHIADYKANADKIGAVYEHMNTNPYKFELFCIERWFIISSFLKKHSIKQCLVMDSDVLVYADAQELSNTFGDAEMTLFSANEQNLSASAHTSFIFNTDILEEFCNYCLDVYSHKLGGDYKSLENHYKSRQARGLDGGVCDMTLLHFFYKKHEHRIFNTSNIVQGDVYIDLQFANLSDNYLTFEADGKHKRVIWKGATPMGRLIRPEAKTIRFFSLHFQAGTKALMPQMITYKGYYYWYNHHYIDLKNKIRRLLPV